MSPHPPRWECQECPGVLNSEQAWEEHAANTGHERVVEHRYGGPVVGTITFTGTATGTRTGGD